MHLPLRISGVGHYLPERIVSNREVEQRLGLPDGAISHTKAGVRERRQIRDETGSYMAAQASLEAVERAGISLDEIDMLIHTSGTPEQAIPDGGALVLKQLGLSGIPAFSVHCTCLSFMMGLQVAGQFLAAGQYRHILIACGEVSSAANNPSEMEAFVLFGDAGAAAVVSRSEPDQSSAITGFAFETFPEGAHFTEVRGCGTRLHPSNPDARPEDHIFHMNGRKVYTLALRRAPPVIERLRPGLSSGLGDIALVVPHQASGLALATMMKTFSWPSERVVQNIDRLGNCVAASIPLALYEAVMAERIQRGEELLFFGTGAGLSVGSMIITY